MRIKEAQIDLSYKMYECEIFEIGIVFVNE